MSITQQQALEALDELEGSARGDEPFNHFAAPLLRQYIEQGAGAAPGADVVMVPRKVLEACSESLGSFCSDHGWSQADMDNMDALDLFLVVQHPQQEQPK
jgi:hypothetical protein